MTDDREDILRRDGLTIGIAGMSLLNGMHFSAYFDPVFILMKQFAPGFFISSPLLIFYFTDARHRRHPGRDLRARQGSGDQHRDLDVDLARRHHAADDPDPAADDGAPGLSRQRAPRSHDFVILAGPRPL